MRRRHLLLIGAVLSVGLLMALWLSGQVSYSRLRNTAALARWFALYQFDSASHERRALGAELYQGQCSSCHGGEQAEAPLLARQAFSRFGDFALAHFLSDGPAPEDMPTYRDRIGFQGVFHIIAYLRSIQDLPAGTPPSPPAVLDGAYKYVAMDGGILIRDMGHEHKVVRRIRIPNSINVRGIAASHKTGRLYVSFDGLVRDDEIGTLVCIDLVTEQILWSRQYSPGVDSMALSPDGSTIYLPNGELAHTPERGEWLILDAITGDERKRVSFGARAHNTIVGPEGKFVYLAAARTNHLAVLDASTNSIVRKIGPFGGPVRPFALTSDGKYALANVNDLLGLEVADLSSGKVIHRVEVEGFPAPDTAPNTVLSHGVALSPDETEAWVVDATHRHIHVFDASGLPRKPRQIASIDVAWPGDRGILYPNWITFSRDGRYAHIGNGAIIDARARQIVTWVGASRMSIEIRFRAGKPVASFQRYGVGYANPAWWSEEEEQPL